MYLTTSGTHIFVYGSVICKTQQMCDKGVLENDGTLKSVADCYKNQQLRDKAIDNYPHALEVIHEYYKAQKMCEKATDTYPPTIKCVSECYKTQEICYKTVHRCFLYFILFLIHKILKKHMR